jgi:HK97 family phage major capsid protein
MAAWTTRGSRLSSEELRPMAEFVRTGQVQAGMSIGSNPDGGYMVPYTVDNVIQSQLVALSPLRNYARIVLLGLGQGRYSFIVNERGATSGWAGETDARSETDTPVLGSVSPPEGDLFCNPKVSQWLLDDSSFNVEEFLQENISDEFAVQEGAAFVSGNGTNKPKGFLSYTRSTDGDGTRAFGTIQYMKSTVADALFPTTGSVSPTDILTDLVYSLRAPYRAGPGVAWLMNSLTAGSIRKLVDGFGKPLWAEGLQAGLPPLLLGYPVAIDENMPDIEANACPVAFGNWRLGYRIVDRLGIRMLRDPYTAKPFVYFYTTKRVGGAVADSNAIKLLKCAA